MAWYKTGTVSLTLNDNVVTGTGTRFASNARVGDGFNGPDGNWYEIVNIASETVLSIYPAYQSNTGTSTSWMIAPLQGYNKESADRLRAITDQLKDLDQEVADAKQAAAESKASAVKSETSANNSLTYSNESARLYNETKASSDKAATSAATATQMRDEAGWHNSQAKVSADAAKVSETNAANSATSSLNSANASALHAQSSQNSANTAATAGRDAALAVVDGKQDKNGKLTTLSNLPGVTNEYTLLALNGTAQQVIQLNIANSPVDMVAGKFGQVGHHGMGTGSAVGMAPSDSADSLPLINGRFTFGNGGSSLPYPYVYIDQYCSGAAGSWVHQVAYALNEPNTWHRYFLAGTTGTPWILTSVGPTASIADKLTIRNNLGLGVPYTYCTDINAMTPSQGLILGYSYVAPATVGTKPPGVAYGVVNTIINSSDHMHQDYVVLTGAASAVVTNPAWRRTGYANVWGPWVQVYDTQSAIKPVSAGADSGLMDVSVYNTNQLVHRYLNGTMDILMPGDNLEMGPNEIRSYAINLPVNFVDLRFYSMGINYQPTLSSDTYGCIYSSMDSTNRANFVMRNGATAQSFVTMRISIRGRWK